MEIKYYLRKFAVSTLVAPAVFGALALGNCHMYHNVSWDTGGVLYLRKMDCIAAHAELQFNYSRRDTALNVYDPFSGGRKYIDNDSDGIFESVEISTGLFQIGDEGRFNPKNHGLSHPDLLEHENKLYQEHLHEFKEDFPEEFKRFGLDDLL